MAVVFGRSVLQNLAQTFGKTAMGPKVHLDGSGSSASVPAGTDSPFFWNDSGRGIPSENRDRFYSLRKAAQWTITIFDVLRGIIDIGSPAVQDAQKMCIGQVSADSHDVAREVAHYMFSSWLSEKLIKWHNMDCLLYTSPSPRD